MVSFISDGSPSDGITPSSTGQCLEMAAVGNAPPTNHNCLTITTIPFPQDASNPNGIMVYGPMPNGGAVVSRLYAQIDVPAPTGGATVEVLDNGTTVVTSCTILANQQSCFNAGGSATNVVAGHYLAVRVTFGGGGTLFFRGSFRF
jgi:hypothetical protein